MSPVNEPAGHRGMMAWFAQNHVAANILMLTILVGGAISLTTNKVEIFPDMSVDIISINVGVWNVKVIIIRIIKSMY